MALGDPRCQPGAYITDGLRLCEIVRQDGLDVIYVDCKSETRWRGAAIRVLNEWKLVQEAPPVPDFVESCESSR
jgi:hypothetical protein